MLFRSETVWLPASGYSSSEQCRIDQLQEARSGKLDYFAVQILEHHFRGFSEQRNRGAARYYKDMPPPSQENGSISPFPHDPISPTIRSSLPSRARVHHSKARSHALLLQKVSAGGIPGRLQTQLRQTAPHLPSKDPARRGGLHRHQPDAASIHSGCDPDAASIFFHGRSSGLTGRRRHPLSWSQLRLHPDPIHARSWSSPAEAIQLGPLHSLLPVVPSPCVTPVLYSPGGEDGRRAGIWGRGESMRVAGKMTSKEHIVGSIPLDLNGLKSRPTREKQTNGPAEQWSRAERSRLRLRRWSGT